MDKKNKNVFLRFIIILFIIYLGLFIASESGYYESKLNKEVVFTNDAIKQFEKDVSEGKKVDLNNYLIKENNNYANFFTKAGDKVSESALNILTDGVSDIIDIFKSLFM